MTTLVKILQTYASTEGLLNGGDICGLPASLATQLIAANIAVEYDAGSGSGTPTTSPFRGIGEGETPAQYSAAGGTLGDQQISAAVEGFLGGADVTIVDGHAQPNSEPWA
jgi:hypothetical protein